MKDTGYEIGAEYQIFSGEAISDLPDIDIGKFILIDNHDGTLSIYDMSTKMPLCLTHKEALALAAMIREQIQSWT